MTTPGERCDWHERELERVDRLAREASDRATDATTEAANRLADISRTLGRLEAHARVQWWLLGAILAVLGAGVALLAKGDVDVVRTASAAESSTAPTAAQAALWGQR